MEITLEQVERLREKMDVSYGEARAALEHSGGDLLGALIWLEEKQGKRTEKGGFYSTDSSARREAEERIVLPADPPRRERPSLGAMLKKLWTVLVENEMEVWRKGKLLSSVPVFILILLLILGFWVVIPVLIIGLFLGCRYTFHGPDLGREDLNDLMSAVSDTAERVAAEFKDGAEQEHTKAGDE